MARKNPAETPLMRQFLEIKREHPDGILFFRMGDFYEMFFEDAVVAARALDLTLTSRDKGKDDAVPMCGVPHHAGQGYIARLTELGHKVVLCEQTEDPKKAKGLVKREVVRIITPGVVLDDDCLDPKVARYVAAVIPLRRGRRRHFGLAYLDVSTGELGATELDSVDALVSEVVRVGPREILGSKRDLAERGALRSLTRRFPGAAYTAFDGPSGAAASELLSRAIAELDAANLDGPEIEAAAAVIAYAEKTQPTGSLPLTSLRRYRPGDAVVLDETAVANLELMQGLMGGKRAGSLLSVIDRTRTAPGARLLRRWLLYPLIEVAPIRRRQDAVEYLVDNASLRAELASELELVSDLERLAGRVSLVVASPLDLGKIRASLARLPVLAEHLSAGRGLAEPPAYLRLDAAALAELAELEAELATALVDEPPARAKDGGFIRDGFCEIIDENRELATGGKDAILAIEARERKRTGISGLRIKYNRVFGYYIEITKSQISRVPDDYVRKQTIATAERYVTTELAELEAKILAAEETLKARELELFESIRAVVAERTGLLISVGRALAAIDCLAGLAEVAHTRGYARPLVDDGGLLEISEGRHPVVELSVDEGSFVPNDCRLDPAGEQVLLITGPNMAGKSTYMRQVAHIVVLAQMGSFVPAASATVGLVDRVFTRVGASDNLARGESTFMVEMRETSAILAEATARSLVVLDEVGRGTSTFDGVSIAWAVTEHLHDKVGARTLFATHYHELCALAESRPRVKNVSVAVREHAGEIVFLRQVVPGGSSRSYGIDVARLAGLPSRVVSRARQILASLEGAEGLGDSHQLGLFGAVSAPPLEPPLEPPPADAEPCSVCERLRDIDPHQTTPLEALALLAELREHLH